jgi:hypothetical protein
MAKRVRVPISTARGQLFQLAELVRRSGDGSVVVLDQRGEPESVALVREARLAYLEERVMTMDRKQAGGFTLAGSLASSTSAAGLEQALRAIRHEWESDRTADPPGRPRARARRRGKA